MLCALQQDIVRLETLQQDVQALRSKSPGEAGDVGKTYLLDLLGNARRRAEAGHYDDAVARLYSAIEKCAKTALWTMQNPDDLQYIQKMVPYVNQGMIERLTYLQTGHALVFGTAINLPTLTKFPEADPKPDSENAKISEKWYIE